MYLYRYCFMEFFVFLLKTIHTVIRSHLYVLDLIQLLPSNSFCDDLGDNYFHYTNDNTFKH